MAKPMLLDRSDLASPTLTPAPRQLGNVWKRFWMSQPKRRKVIGVWWAVDRENTPNYTRWSPSEELPARKASRAGAGNPELVTTRFYSGEEATFCPLGWAEPGRRKRWKAAWGKGTCGSLRSIVRLQDDQSPMRTVLPN